MIILESEVDGASEGSLARFLTRARREVGLRGKVNVVITSNNAVRELNRRFRKKNKPTDVLSFPAAEEFQPDFAGDIVVSGDIAAESAKQYGHSGAMELKILVLHGLLHLAGYDHEHDEGKMERKERKLRKSLRLPDGLIERTIQGSDGLSGVVPRSRATLATRKSRQGSAENGSRKGSLAGVTRRSRTGGRS
ncbi:MAG TPA: rRNA maturation RNase YbeY [Terriglobales bacterium]|nr:rRNA maturation RNase YbeY [Terriglobales bacterium]